ncbi:translocation/assembly module TamB domain-containing protein [Anaeromyxobacter sp. Red801]|uniref:translocation/assembly module TamB domain-containing protein n=1 Tax=Anaeromyxobacter sp. Red801 TaxID=3411632 RepID=UPI003B9F778C
MKKRTVALVFLLVVVGLVLATLAALRTRWAGDRICALAAEKVRVATGLPLSFAACRIDPLGFAVDAEGVVLGPPAAPAFVADAITARLALVQALGRRVHLDRLRLVRPRLVAALPRGGGAPSRCPPELLGRFEIRELQVEGGSVELGLPDGGHVSLERLEIRSGPPARTLRSLATPARRSRVEVSAGPVRVDAVGRRWSASQVRARGEIALDLSIAEIAGIEAEVGGARLGLEGRVHDLCAPKLDLTARAEGRVDALLALAGVHADVEGTAAVEARIAGTPRAPELSGSLRTRGVRVDGFVPGDAEAVVRLSGRTLVVDRLAVAAAGGGAAVAHGTVTLARGLPIEAEVQLDRVDLAEILDRLTVKQPWITLRLDGKARVAGTLSPPALAGTLAADLHDFRALGRPYTQAHGDPGIVSFARGRIESAVRVDRSGLFLDGARVAVGQGTVDADAAIHFDGERGFHVRCRGVADLDALGPLAGIPWAGRLAIEAEVGAAPYGNPVVTGRARGEGLHFLQVDLGHVAADFRYRDFLLHFQGAEGTRGETRYRGEAVVDLSRTPTQIVSSRLEARGRLRDLFDSVMEWIPTTRYVRDALDAEVEATGTARGPATALDASFDARLGAGTLLGRAFDSGRAQGRIEAGRTARFERAELRRGTGVARAQGTWGMDAPFPWDLEVAFSGVPLAALDLPGGEWSGSASGRASLGGSFDHPDVRFAANGDAVRVAGVALGTVQAGGTVVERKLTLTGGAEGLAGSAEIALQGRLPFQARATVAMDDAARLWPGGPPPGLRIRVGGEGSASGELEDLSQARASVRLPQLSIALAEVKVEAAGPAVLTVRGERVELAPVTLRGTSTELTVSGAAAPGAVDLSASGTLDLRLAGALSPVVRRAHGQLALEAHMGGTFDQPVLVGSGRVADGGFELRGAGLVFSDMAGPLAFSQNRVLFEDLGALLNGGHARFTGEVELARLAPSRLRVEGTLDEVPVALPSYLPATLSGRIEAQGTPEATDVTGRLRVVRARYTADVDLEGSLLELRRRPPPPPKPYDKAGEWLRFDLQLVVDGDARIENDLVRGTVAGDLTLTGTLASPGLVGSLTMGQGSRAAFRGNEFTLTHAVLELVDRNKIEIVLDVHGDAQVRDYQVFMHAFGPLEQPRVTLTSAPPLPEPDLVTLLSLGFTRRDSAAGTGVGGVATAAAAQAIFSASGLDEQVRRFLPRGGPIRDIGMRITSAYSEATGQVEPRAEFESWLLRDRLRLRFQAPLAGARGRKAQAELRLGEHTAVQYQWDSDNPDVSTGDHGVDLKLRWEWTDRE